jgi:ribosome assembly protein 1
MVRVEALYTMMGRELVPVNEVLAGNVFAIAGLEGKVWRNATLCSPGAGGVGKESPWSTSTKMSRRA